MPVVALDTHAVVKELQAAGFTEARAEAVSRAVRKGQDTDLSNLATKADLRAPRFEFEGLRKETRAGINALKFGLLKWSIGAIGVQTIVIPGAVLTLARILAH